MVKNSIEIMRNLKDTIKKHEHIYKKYRYVKEVFTWIAETKYRKCSDSAKMKELKDRKIGKRCFIIGNGPSLQISDLERLKNEDTFAVNRIYKIFDRTDWRPTYYCSQDSRIIDEISGDFREIADTCKIMFIRNCAKKESISGINNLVSFYLDVAPTGSGLPRFSMNVDKRIYEGCTVAYASLQIAVYMGYSEIYIIGTDHNYNLNLNNRGRIEQNGNVTNYMKGLEGKLVFVPQLEKTTNAYKKARLVCEQRGIVVKNATRGGKLEVFDRVDFDLLF